jgi:hypothetical protein
MVTEDSILAGVTVGVPVSRHNLTMFPLIAEIGGEPDYLTLDAALTAGTAKITEVSAGGSVPELRFVNSGDLAVLLLDGEELVGAKQNRVLNLTILAPPHSELVIPVSCVEHGRWHSMGADFMSSPRTHYASGRAAKMADVSMSLREEGHRRSNQGEMWDDIARKSTRMHSRSATGAMADMFDQHRHTLSDYAAGFRSVERQTGALFAINGRVVGMDVFDYPATLASLLPKLVSSFALDAIDAGDSGSAGARPEDAKALLAAVEGAHVDTFPAIGEGTDLRLDGNGITGAALRARDRIVHLNAFRWEGRGQSREYESVNSRLSRASQRGRPPVV